MTHRVRAVLIGVWMLEIAVLYLAAGCKPRSSAPTVPTKGEDLIIGERPTPTPTPEPPVRHVEPGHEPQPVKSPPPRGIQVTRWNEAKLKTSWEISLDRAVMLYLRTKDRYEAVAKMRGDGVPAPVIFALHYRESSNSFKAHLHEGSSLLHRTRYVPKNRLPAPKNPPYDWEVSAEDAIYVCDKLQGEWGDLQRAIDKMESYNGLGYRKMGRPSPYLWSGTTAYVSGKYVADGRYNSQAIDQQLGVCAILKRMQEKGIDIPFAP